MIRVLFAPLFRVFAAVCLAGLLIVPARADIVINGTRVIYSAKEREVTVQLTNDEKTDPRLVRAWIDSGDVHEPPDHIDVPFTLTPPMFRLDAGRSQALRIMYIPGSDKARSLPKDKESVFWLNVLAVPPKPADAADGNILQFAFRTRIKLFFRSEGLVGRPDGAPAQLTWKLVSSGAEPALEVHNPSAYHISFAKVALRVGGKDIQSDAPPMLSPGSTGRYVLKGLTHTPDATAEVHFSAVDDYGGEQTYAAKLQSD
ncbi:fimbria/pilus periplasmic chaperone [Dyella subtropica]|uniref:fimbria/pilus periplasmic chaperone n=1 Tax=Dyella subtropica TaxID=2992127 RepID=UPI0022536E4C|nr:fimbria/pilus periplasmic chaperone [Dyella subtropica]